MGASVGGALGDSGVVRALGDGSVDAPGDGDTVDASVDGSEEPSGPVPVGVVPSSRVAGVVQATREITAPVTTSVAQVRVRRVTGKRIIGYSRVDRFARTRTVGGRLGRVEAIINRRQAIRVSQGILGTRWSVE